jgi:hypothetical protein
MSKFEIINTSSDINLSNNWKLPTNFKSKGKFVDDHGRHISTSYTGKRYVLIEKREMNIPLLTKVTRIFLGSLAVIATLGIALCSKSIRDLFTKKKFSIHFGTPSPQESHSRKDDNGAAAVATRPNTPASGRSLSTTTPSADSISTKEEISITEPLVAQIQASMPDILAGKEAIGLKFYHSKHGHRVFSLASAPDLIFKMLDDSSHPEPTDSMQARHATSVDARNVCRENHLDLLVIPQNKLFKVVVHGKEYEILAEKKVDINYEISVQEAFYDEYAESLNKAIEQLAIFTCITGYYDIELRNNPVMNNSLDKNGNRKIALIDLEKMGNPKMGLIGGYRTTGLVGCVNEHQAMIIKDVAKKYGIHFNGSNETTLEEVIALRKIELEKNQKLKEFYARKKIVTGTEQIPIDEGTLDFSSFPRANIIKEAALTLLKKLNQEIASSSPEKSLKRRRFVFVDTHEKDWSHWARITADEKDQDKPYDEFVEATFLGIAVNKLIELGLIFELSERNGHGYYIQA